MAKGGTSLDQALDALYGASPAEFTAQRDALSKKLVREGDRAAAAALKRQRKPTQLAFVLNQLARRNGDELADLVDVGRELARAQRKALRGEAGTELRDAIARQRAAVAALTAKTAALMKELGVAEAGHLDEIASALQAALVDPAVGARLEEGRLDRVPAAAAGFHGPLAPDVPAEGNGHRPAQARARADAKTRSAENRQQNARQQAEARLREAARAAAAEADERARVADAAEREADGRAAQAKKLAEHAATLAAEAERLATDAKRAAREAHLAELAAAKAASARTSAEADAKRARSDADRARKRATAVERRSGAGRHDVTLSRLH